jgi:Bacterial regulatory proteins, gntR family
MIRNHEIAAVPPAPDVSLEQRAYAALRDSLNQGGFPPGEKLSIRRIAAALGVSPMPARCAAPARRETLPRHRTRRRGGRPADHA